jgi:hypothetical protein
MKRIAVLVVLLVAVVALPAHAAAVPAAPAPPQMTVWEALVEWIRALVPATTDNGKHHADALCAGSGVDPNGICPPG